MPNRLIKESIRTSEKVNEMTDFQFRLWVSLITYVDDYGRGDARPAIIKGLCFPLRERVTVKDIDAALQALAGIGCVGLYEVDGKPYLYFPRWESHQTIRNQKSKFPAPDSENAILQANESSCKQMHTVESKCPRNPIQSESESESNIKAQVCAERPPLEIALDEFAKMRKALRKPLTDKARALTMAELEKLAPGDEKTQIAIINQSIQRGWQGVFPLKSEQGKTGPKIKTPYDGSRSNAVPDDGDYLRKILGVQE